MKKLKTIATLGICVLTAILTISANFPGIHENEDISINNNRVRFFGLRDFINMDLRFIGYFPTKEHWSQINRDIKIVPADSLRFIDSLDVKKLADTLYVKIYSQNHACQSRNIYTIAKNKNKSSDTLMIYNINIDLQFKNIIDNAETFRVNNFTVDYAIKQHIDNIDKRIIFNKNYR